MVFKPGQSGNPKGRPKGKWYEEQRAYLKKHSPEIMRVLVEDAIMGKKDALKLAVERILPPLKAGDVPLAFDIKKITGSDAKTLTELGEQLINSAGEGELNSSQAIAFFQMIAEQRKLIEVDTVQKQLEELKEAINK